MHSWSVVLVVLLLMYHSLAAVFCFYNQVIHYLSYFRYIFAEFLVQSDSKLLSWLPWSINANLDINVESPCIVSYFTFLNRQWLVQALGYIILRPLHSSSG
jgi:hypothetical protein